MKTFIAIASLIVAITGFSPAATAMPQKELIVGINDAHIPERIGVGASAYAVVSGLFPNGCYSWNRAEVSRPEDFVTEVRVVANVTQGMCIMVLVPFTKEVTFGRLPAGEHKIRFVSGDGTYMEKRLIVE